MNSPLNRRDFLAVSVSATAAAGAALAAGPSLAHAATFKTKLAKALIGGTSEKNLQKLKDAGFDGIETGWNVKPDAAAEARKVAEKVGVKIHSVLRGWTNFNNPKATPKDIASVETALKAARGFGADAVLLVPCRLTGKGIAVPQPWEFDIEFDEKTGHVAKVVKGDNAEYAAYIKAQNDATDMSREALKKLIPTAKETGVKIALENVWNNFWVKPKLFANFVASFQSEWVAAYFDIGNHVKYAPPQDWIQALGKTIVKCHVKDFKLNPNGQGGRFCNIRDGSVNWPLVRKELDKIGYNGWMTIEGSGGLSVQDRSKRLDLIIAGK